MPTIGIMYTTRRTKEIDVDDTDMQRLTDLYDPDSEGYEEDWDEVVKQVLEKHLGVTDTGKLNVLELEGIIIDDTLFTK